MRDNETKIEDIIWKDFETRTEREPTQSLFKTDTETISITDYQYFYLCIKCHKYPLIEFCKDKKHIKYSCSCVNNKKIKIKDYLDDIYSNSFSLLSGSFLSESSLSSSQNIFNKKENIKGLTCQKFDNNKSSGFCRNCLLNLCQNCINGHEKEHEIIKFEDIEIDNNFINMEMKKFEENNLNFSETSSNKMDTIIIKQNCNNSKAELVNKEMK
jgi:hypothetical protein